MSTTAETAMLALLDVLHDITTGRLTVDVGIADDLHRALQRLALIGIKK